MTAFRGLTWDHPRGYAALERASAEAGNIITWERQPLEGFESAPIDQVCAGYDLVVLDHPHLGDALAAQCLTPLDNLLPAPALDAIKKRTLGPCFQSYEMDLHVWALPLDAAAQVTAVRPDLVSAGLPDTFADLDRFADIQAGFVLSLAGPHAFLTLLSLSAGQDMRFGRPEEGYFQPHHDDAIELFVSLARRSDPVGLTHNPVALLEAMTRSEVSYCPFVFGYVTYSDQRAGQRLLFLDPPRPRIGAPPRGVLGGTGIAVTRGCQPNKALISHLTALLDTELQEGLIPENGGQPSAQHAWMSPRVNGATSGFYQQTIDTLHHAFIRPRHRGFVATQTRAATWLRNHLADRLLSSAVVRSELNAILRGA